ncbi:MAG: arsenite methyltransferase [Sphingomonadaceae bacterium]
MSQKATGDRIREAVRERYAEEARRVRSQRGGGCCSGPTELGNSRRLYTEGELSEVPQEAALASLGCGNPTLLAELKPGEVVLDLGSGGGIDVLLSAKRVGPAGKAYGLDMTDEMLELARENARKAGVANVEFLKGQIESIPLPDSSVDVIISNCVINLSADKDAVFREAYRVLKRGGRFAVADIVVQNGPLPAAIREMLALWAGCVAGALGEEEYRQKLAAAGFVDVDLQVLKSYGLEDVPEEMRCCVPPGLSLPGDTRVISAFIRATKGETGSEAGIHQGATISGRTETFKVTTTSAPSCCGRTVEGKPSPSGCCGDEVRDYFDKVAPMWDEMRRSYFTEEVRDAAIARARLQPEAVIADVGTGTGFMLAGVAPVVRKAYGFDNSAEMLEVARANLGGLGSVELRLSEGASLPLPDGVLDAVFANMYLHHAPDPAAAIVEMARVLKPGGRLVITDMDRHDHEWMRAEMADLWMGFDREQVAAWYRAAGLSEVAVECTGSNCCSGSSCGDRVSIGVFVASGTKV